MTVLEFLFSGTNPATIAGLTIILGILLVSVMRAFTWAGAVCLIFGGSLCAVNFIQIVKLGKDGLEISTKAAEAIVKLSAEVTEQSKRTAQAIENLNSQILSFGNTQRSLTEQLAQTAPNMNNVDPEKWKTLKSLIEGQTLKTDDLFKKNQSLATELKNNNTQLKADVGDLKSILQKYGKTVDG